MRGNRGNVKTGKARRWKRTIIGVIALYPLSYGVLSSQGEYVPGWYGAGWVKRFQWAPLGFVSGEDAMDYSRVNIFVNYFYYPLLTLDRKYLHVHDKARSGEYPVNMVLDRALNESYGEWFKGEQKSREESGSEPKEQR
jgi:hypothetical protein